MADFVKTRLAAVSSLLKDLRNELPHPALEMETVMRIRIAIAAIAALSALPAIADDMGGMNMDGGSAPATKEYMKAMESMHDAMRTVKPTNDPNRDFVLMMKPHHQAAVEMAKTYLKYGSDPLLKRLAENIIASQNKEIAEMSAWQIRQGK